MPVAIALGDSVDLDRNASEVPCDGRDPLSYFDYRSYAITPYLRNVSVTGPEEDALRLLQLLERVPDDRASVFQMIERRWLPIGHLPLRGCGAVSLEAYADQDSRGPFSGGNLTANLRGHKGNSR